jgi:hypothetical protein
MRSIAIIHFNPISQYPPALNFINFLDEELEDKNIYIYTTKVPEAKTNIKEKSERNEIKFKYYKFNQKASFLLRLWKYCVFYLNVLINLIKTKPSAIIYYETISCIPGIFYKKFCSKKISLVAHHHEYYSIEEYKHGSFINRFCWKIEKNHFHLLTALSHTNEDRIRLFKQDYPDVTFNKILAVPNFPPKSWVKENPTANISNAKVIRMVHLGYGLSFETMYIKEFFEWIEQQEGRIILDCYVKFVDEKTEQYLRNFPSKYINLKSPIDYYKVPKILFGYEVGVILYKGHIPNCIYIAPNKLFEYLVNGLDVWYPQEMKGCAPYTTKGTYPKVIAVDFKNMNRLAPDIFSHQGLKYILPDYHCEQIYPELLEHLLSNS